MTREIMIHFHPCQRSSMTSRQIYANRAPGAQRVNEASGSNPGRAGTSSKMAREILQTGCEDNQVRSERKRWVHSSVSFRTRARQCLAMIKEGKC